MHRMRFAKKIVLVEALGFSLITLVLWVDEIYDLPHLLLGGPATPINLVESWLETTIVLILALVVMGISALLGRRLQRSDMEKSWLFGVVSHDLRSPFTNLLGNAELLHENYSSLSEEDRRALNDGIYEAATKAHELLENLLLWAQLQLEKFVSASHSCDLHELVEECRRHCGPAAKGKQIVIANGVAAGTWVDIDPTAIRSVIRNLLSNAIKFSQPGGSIEVAAKATGTKVRVSVADHGMGIGREELKGLFHMGTCLTRRGTAGESGSGLGLLLSYELIRRSGSKLQVHSEVGLGSTFCFSLPQAQAGKPVPEPPARGEEGRPG